MYIIAIEEECYGITDEDCKAYPALVGRGCSCCQTYRRVTRENLDQAIAEAEEWLAKLRATEPVKYPADVTGGEPKKK